jgi:hypothetical protein
MLKAPLIKEIIPGGQAAVNGAEIAHFGRP